MTWTEEPEPTVDPIGFAGWVRAALRGLPLGLLVFGGLLVLLLLRLVERPVFGLHRPITPSITRFVCRMSLRILGIGFQVSGAPMSQPGGVVSNHASWLDIFALNAAQRVYFVSKAEVAQWPGIGWLARAVGTVFIRRDPRDAGAQKTVFEQRLTAGHKLLFFPEGTSSDGLRVLPFKPTLFAAFFTEGLRELSYIQPTTLSYITPAGGPANFYGWWGEMEFGPHLLLMLSARKHGRIEVVFQEPLKVSSFTDRKALSAACETAVRGGLNPAVLSAP